MKTFALNAQLVQQKLQKELVQRMNVQIKMLMVIASVMEMKFKLKDYVGAQLMLKILKMIKLLLSQIVLNIILMVIVINVKEKIKLKF